MEEEYLSTVTAHHYHAYRPPLHAGILARCLTERNYGKGLDVGCGAGHSSRALLPYCEEIWGIDPSPTMLSMTGSHSRIQYSHYDQAELPMANDSTGLITFAGSWYYAKSQQLLDEVIRVSKSGATLLIYDFKVSFVSLISIFPTLKQTSSYNHSENLAGLRFSGFTLQKKIIDKIYFKITALDLTHLILSESVYFMALSRMYPDSDLQVTLPGLIECQQGSELIALPAEIFAYEYVLHTEDKS